MAHVIAMANNTLMVPDEHIVFELIQTIVFFISFMIFAALYLCIVCVLSCCDDRPSQAERMGMEMPRSDSTVTV